ncbi:MAG: hypothetical protein KGJ59_11810 [Bacteroidota bacterium]|nr:hypothetical protein [Bacteroidota bacterium]
MLEQDYFMRMISQLTAVLSEVLFHKKAQQMEEARGGIRTGVKSLLGFDLDLLHSFSDAQILELLNTSGELDAAKCYATAMLLKEEAGIDAVEGKTAESVGTAEKALSLMLEMILSGAAGLPASTAADAEALIEILSPYELPLHIEEKIFRYYEQARRYDKAEDTLFGIVERSHQFVPEGLQFYQRLLKKSDEELQAGNLPRGEAEEGAAELRRIAVV